MANELPIKEHKFQEGYLPPSIKVFSAAVGCFGLALLYFENFVGIIPMLLAIVAIGISHGYETNFETKSHRHYFVLFGQKFGKWTKVENPIGVIVTKERLKEKTSSFSLTSFTTNIAMWQVTLKLKGEDEELFIHETENIKEACSIALLMIAMFKVLPYSKYVSKERQLNYPMLRKGIVSFGNVVMK